MQGRKGAEASRQNWRGSNDACSTVRRKGVRRNEHNKDTE